MRLIVPGPDLKDDPTAHFGFEPFVHSSADFVLIQGRFPISLYEMPRENKFVYLEFEEPNRFLMGHVDHREDFFYRILTICPYTAAWKNAETGSDRWVPVFFPFNGTFIPRPTQKIFDVIYTGRMVAPELRAMVVVMKHFNHAFVCDMADPEIQPLVTHPAASYPEKLQAIAQSRITIVHNLLYIAPEYAALLEAIPNWRGNDAFRLVGQPVETGQSMVLPQVKSRLFEAAFCRSLILCRRDPWNIVERFFEPEREFIYFEPDRLKETLTEILANYGDYQPVIDRAFERACDSYTSAHFFSRYLQPIEI